MNDLFKLKGYDYTLLITPFLLAGFGIMMIYSASMVSTVVDGLDSTYYLFKQLQWFTLGFLGFIFGAVFPYRRYLKLTVIIIIGSIGISIATLLIGDTVHRATRSLEIFGFNIQASEFIKLALIIYLAAVYSKKQRYISNFTRGVLPPLVLTSFIVLLIVAQPDIGTAVIILLIAGTIVVSSGMRIRHIVLLATIGVTIVLLVAPHMVTETRIARVTGAYHPFESPDEGGYHLIQSYLAISGGGISGEGLGQSIQKLGYLWGAHTDFIMAVIAEELGVFGVILAVGMLALISLRGLHIAKKCRDGFGSLLAIGISSMVAIQAIINLGAISGILPITGVPLPFISYGGSSLLALMVSMGILNNIARSVKLQEHGARSIETKPIHKFYRKRGSRWST